LEKEMKAFCGALDDYWVVWSQLEGKVSYWHLKNADFTFELSCNSLRELTCSDKYGIDLWAEIVDLKSKIT
jgi:hypothetical protein